MALRKPSSRIKKIPAIELGHRTRTSVGEPASSRRSSTLWNRAFAGNSNFRGRKRRPSSRNYGPSGSTTDRSDVFRAPSAGDIADASVNAGRSPASGSGCGGSRPKVVGVASSRPRPDPYSSWLVLSERAPPPVTAMRGRLNTCVGPRRSPRARQRPDLCPVPLTARRRWEKYRYRGRRGVDAAAGPSPGRRGS